MMNKNSLDIPNIDNTVDSKNVYYTCNHTFNMSIKFIYPILTLPNCPPDLTVGLKNASNWFCIFIGLFVIRHALKCIDLFINSYFLGKGSKKKFKIIMENSIIGGEGGGQWGSFSISDFLKIFLLFFWSKNHF